MPFATVFHSVGGQKLLYVGLLEHEACSSLFLFSLQHFSTFLYLGNVFIDHLALHIILKLKFQKN